MTKSSLAMIAVGFLMGLCTDVLKLRRFQPYREALWVAHGVS